MKQWIVRWVAVGLVIWSLPAWGEDVKSSQEAMSVLDTIVVTAGRVSEKKEDVSTNITVLSGERIQQSSARHLGELLGEEGFMIIEYPNSLISVGIRGFRTQTQGNDLSGHILVLINGRRAGTGNLAEIMLDNVERVEIIRGPGAVQYGSSAMGGVINVITKQGLGKPSFSLAQTLGSWNYQKSTVDASGEFKNFDFSFSGSTASQDDYSTADGKTYYNTGFDSKDRISISAGWTFMPENRIGLIYNGYEAEGVGSPNYLSKNDLDDYVDHYNKTFDVVYDGQTADGFLLWNLRYFKTKGQYNNFDPTSYGNTAFYKRETDQQGGQAQVTADLDHTRLTAGIDWALYKIQDTYTTGDNTYENPAAFLLAKVKLLDEKLVLSAGVRYDQYEVEDDDGKSIDDSNWTPSLGVTYKIIQGLNLRANYAEAFRMPTADELFTYADYTAIGFGIWSGNPNLVPEQSKTYEIGVDFSKWSCSGGVTYFYTKFEDKISYAYDPVAAVTRYENIKGATISGIEGSFSMDFGPIFDWNCKLKPYGSVTYLAEYTDDENNIDLFYNPQWTLSYGIEFAKPGIGLVSRLNFAYISEQDITDYEGTGDTTLDAYTAANLTISKELFSFDRFGRIMLKADIANLFNEDYAVIQGYPSPGRTYYFGLQYVY